MFTSRSHWFLNILIVLVYTFSSGQDIKEWSQDNGVKLSDFRATPDDNSQHAASINTGIKYSWKTKIINAKKTLSYNIIAYMTPSNSWVKPSQKSNYILSHEQLHFDIT